MPFYLIFTSILFIGCTYISLRLIPRTSLKSWKKALAYALCYSPMLYVPLRYTTRNMAATGVPIPPELDMALFCSHVLIGTLSVLATVIFAYDIFLIGRKIYTLLHKPTQKIPKKTKNPNPPNPIDKSRRNFMQNTVSAGLLAVGGGFVSYGTSQALPVPQVKHITIPIENLPKEFHGYSIAQITDLHINKPIPPSRMQGIVDKIHAEKPDAIAITGDLSDSFPHQIREELAPLASLRAPDGVYFVSGNHEYYTSIAQWRREVARLGIDELRNEHRVIQRDTQRLLICGVPDIQQSSLSSPKHAQQGSHEEDIKILLSHQPQNIYEASQYGYHLHMCGHTHGGQFFPWTLVTDYVQPYIHGLYKVENTHLYVNRGTGFWGPPLRIGAPPEIALFKLMPA